MDEAKGGEHIGSINSRRISSVARVASQVASAASCYTARHPLSRSSNQLKTLNPQNRGNLVDPSRNQRNCWVIDPRYDAWIGYWDLVTSMALIFTALVTPVEVSFLKPADIPARWTRPLFVLNRIIDSVFIFDMFLQLRVAYQAGDSNHAKLWVHDPWRIVKHYLLSRWFVLDIFSVCTSGFDFMSSGGGASSLTGLRAVRVLRLIKLLRLLRGSRIFKRWEMRVSINYSYLALLQITVSIILCVHWFACIWGLQAGFNIHVSWPAAVGYCAPWGSANMTISEAASLSCPNNHDCEPPICTSGVCVPGTDCVEPMMMYMYALYWSVMTITSVGYGDVSDRPPAHPSPASLASAAGHHWTTGACSFDAVSLVPLQILATPFNVTEQMICTMMMLVGGMLWGYLIGTFAGLAASLSPSTREFHEEMSKLNQFMARYALPQKDRFQLREYMHESVHLRNTEAQDRLLSRLSPALQGAVAWRVNKEWIEKIWYFHYAEKSAMIELAFALRARVFPPSEMCSPGDMYIINRGRAIWGGKVYGEGGVWGEDVLLDSPRLQIMHPAVAITYLWVYTIDGHRLQGIIHDFPKTEASLRRLRCRWLMRRGFILAAWSLRLGKLVPSITDINAVRDPTVYSGKSQAPVLMRGSSSSTHSELPTPLRKKSLCASLALSPKCLTRGGAQGGRRASVSAPVELLGNLAESYRPRRGTVNMAAQHAGAPSCGTTSGPQCEGGAVAKEQAHSSQLAQDVAKIRSDLSQLTSSVQMLLKMQGAQEIDPMRQQVPERLEMPKSKETSSGPPAVNDLFKAISAMPSRDESSLTA